MKFNQGTNVWVKKNHAKALSDEVRKEFIFMIKTLLLCFFACKITAP